VALGHERGKGRGRIGPWCGLGWWKRVVLALAQTREKKGGEREKKKRGGSVPSHVSHPGKEREGKRGKETGRDEREGAMQMSCMCQNFGKLQIHKSWGKREGKVV
jgi:hypothetical protein